MSEHDEDTQLAKGKVQVGDLAPGFTLLNQSGTVDKQVFFSYTC